MEIGGFTVLNLGTHRDRGRSRDLFPSCPIRPPRGRDGRLFHSLLSSQAHLVESHPLRTRPPSLRAAFVPSAHKFWAAVERERERERPGVAVGGKYLVLSEEGLGEKEKGDDNDELLIAC